VSVAVNGNGIIGEITEPACGATAKSGKLKFESVATGTQKWTQVTTEGTKFDLTSSENGGAARTSSWDLESSITFMENQTVTC
jgi:hypothetical protein